MQDDRWEYRIWPDASAGMVESLTNLLGQAVRTEARNDTYFLTLADDVLAKIRGGQHFEVKRRLEEREGCEHWVKEVKQPIGQRGGFHQMLGDQIEKPAAKAWLESAGNGIAIVEVRKQRQLFSILEADVEATTISIPGKRLDTVALEAPSFELCNQLAEKLGFKEHANQHFGVALRNIR